jgi:hypothetical protein
VRAHAAGGSDTLRNRIGNARSAPKDGLLGHLVGVIKACGTPLLPGPAPARVTEQGIGAGGAGLAQRLVLRNP